MCAGAGAEMAEQALDGRHGAERIVAKADGEGFGLYRSKGQGPEVAGAGELLKARAECHPVLDHACRGVFEPAQALAREVAAEPGEQRHDGVPLGEHLPALCGRIVTPAGKLRPYGHYTANNRPGRCQACCTAAKAVADHIDRLARVLALCALEERFKVQ